MRHDSDYLIMTEDLGIKISMSEYDLLSPSRIKRIIDIQQQRLEYKAKRAEDERRQQERSTVRRTIMKK